MKAKYASILLFLVIGTALFSYWCAKFNYESDFSAFYRAASIALDNTTPVTDVYLIDDTDVAQYHIPPTEVFQLYKYSVLVAYLLAPLALFDYYTAKAIFIFINIIAYIISVALLLRLGGAKGRWFSYPLIFSLLWMPFIQNIRYGQSNAIILLFITIGIIQATRNGFLTAGIALALATLFKPFALAVTMVLCVKNWRIALGYLGFMGLALLLLPGTREWFQSFLWPPYNPGCYPIVYRYLSSMEPYCFTIYALVIGGLTALITLYNRNQNFFAVGAFAVPAAFLAMPILEVNHLTILILSFTFFISRKLAHNVSILAIISFLLVSWGSASAFRSLILYSGIMLIWLTMMGLFLTSRDNVQSRNIADIPNLGGEAC